MREQIQVPENLSLLPVREHPDFKKIDRKLIGSRNEKK